MSRFSFTLSPGGARTFGSSGEREWHYDARADFDGEFRPARVTQRSLEAYVTISTDKGALLRHASNLMVLLETDDNVHSRGAGRELCGILSYIDREPTPALGLIVHADLAIAHEIWTGVQQTDTTAFVHIDLVDGIILSPKGQQFHVTKDLFEDNSILLCLAYKTSLQIRGAPR